MSWRWRRASEILDASTRGLVVTSCRWDSEFVSEVRKLPVMVKDGSTCCSESEEALPVHRIGSNDISNRSFGDGTDGAAEGRRREEQNDLEEARREEERRGGGASQAGTGAKLKNWNGGPCWVSGSCSGRAMHIPYLGSEFLRFTVVR